MGTGMVERRVVAANPSRDSENRIHADEVAQSFGFRGGLVPGVTVYGYVADLLADTLGPAWVGSGGADVRFRRPTYDGDELIIRLIPPPGDPAPAGDPGPSDDSGRAGDPGRAGDSRPAGEGEWGIEVVTGDGVAVTGSAAVGPGMARAGGGGSGAGEPAAGLVPPASARPAALRPVVSEEYLAPGTVLGSIALDTSAEAAAAYAEKIGARSQSVAGPGWVHPGMLLDSANWVLMAHVVMPLWLHVGSSIRHLRPVVLGEAIQVRARIAKEWETKGHRFVTLDVAWVGAEPADVVAEASHTAIWHLAGT